MFKLNSRLLIFTILFGIICNAQKSENIIPRQASTVFSINKINLLKKISLDDLVA